MGLDVLKRKCGVHNRVLPARETCPDCVRLARQRVRQAFKDEPSRDPERPHTRPSKYSWIPVGYHPDSCPHDGLDPQTRTCWDCKTVFAELDLVTS